MASVIQTGQTGGSYSAAPAGLSINSTTGQINLGTSSAGIYSVTYSFTDANSCNNTTTASVTVRALPTIYSLTGGGTYCSVGSGVAVGLSGSQIGVSYQLKKDGVDTGSPVAGSGAAITFGNQTAAGTYTVLAKNTTTYCTQAMTGSATVTVTTATVTVTPNTQQYSDKVTFVATLSPNTIPLNGSNVDFYVGSQKVGTATLAIDATVLKATLADVALLAPSTIATA